jgi:hypothetical protein
MRTVGQFCEIVKKMRTKQKAYFRAGAFTEEKKTLLNESKILEKEVDEWIHYREERIAAREQPELGL